MESADQAATQVVSMLADGGRDYAPKHAQISEFFHTYLWHGNWDGVLQFEDAAYPDLRFIQEDEFDQHMDDDPDAPEHDEQLGYTAGHYVFLA